MASSRVGVTTSTRTGPLGWSSPSREICTSSRDARAGTMNAHVLPVPVRDRATTSRPSSASGSRRAWISVGRFVPGGHEPAEQSLRESEDREPGLVLARLPVRPRQGPAGRLRVFPRLAGAGLPGGGLVTCRLVGRGPTRVCPLGARGLAPRTASPTIGRLRCPYRGIPGILCFRDIRRGRGGYRRGRTGRVRRLGANLPPAAPALGAARFPLAGFILRGHYGNRTPRPLGKALPLGGRAAQQVV